MLNAQDERVDFVNALGDIASCRVIRVVVIVPAHAETAEGFGGRLVADCRELEGRGRLEEEEKDE